jgi:hypothetical protein
LEDYLNCIFNYSDTQTYYFGLDSLNRAELQIGDFIVKKGKKGHAVVIVDLAQNQRGEWVGLIAQGDTPACQLYILNYMKDNPWVPLNFEEDALPLPIRKKMTWDGLRRFAGGFYANRNQTFLYPGSIPGAGTGCGSEKRIFLKRKNNKFQKKIKNS